MTWRSLSPPGKPQGTGPLSSGSYGSSSPLVRAAIHPWLPSHRQLMGEPEGLTGLVPPELGVEPSLNSGVKSRNRQRPCFQRVMKPASAE